MEKKKNSRKIYLINPKFQWTVIAWMAVLAGTISGIYFLSNFIFFRQLNALGLEQGLPKDALYFKFVHQQQVQMEIIFAATSLLSFALIIAFGIFASHRIAGPIYRMCQYFKQQDVKNLPDLKFRDNDFFQELSASYNEFKDRIKQT